MTSLRLKQTLAETHNVAKHASSGRQCLMYYILNIPIRRGAGGVDVGVLISTPDLVCLQAF